MSFKDQLMEEMKQAMRDKNTAKLGVVRYLMSEIKNAEIDEGELSDEAIEKIVSKQIKQMKDAIQDYEKAGREELVLQETEKISLLEAYLPEQMSDEELAQIVEEVVSAADEKNMGMIIGQVMQKVKGQADGRRVSMMVKEKLQ